MHRFILFIEKASKIWIYIGSANELCAQEHICMSVFYVYGAFLRAEEKKIDHEYEACFNVKASLCIWIGNWTGTKYNEWEWEEAEKEHVLRKKGKTSWREMQIDL